MKMRERLRKEVKTAEIKDLKKQRRDEDTLWQLYDSLTMRKMDSGNLPDLSQEIFYGETQLIREIAVVKLAAYSNYACFNSYKVNHRRGEKQEVSVAFVIDLCAGIDMDKRVICSAVCELFTYAVGRYKQTIHEEDVDKIMIFIEEWTWRKDWQNDPLPRGYILNFIYELLNKCYYADEVDLLANRIKTLMCKVTFAREILRVRMFDCEEFSMFSTTILDIIYSLLQLKVDHSDEMMAVLYLAALRAGVVGKRYLQETAIMEKEKFKRLLIFDTQYILEEEIRKINKEGSTLVEKKPKKTEIVNEIRTRGSKLDQMQNGLAHDFDSDETEFSLSYLLTYPTSMEYLASSYAYFYRYRSESVITPPLSVSLDPAVIVPQEKQHRYERLPSFPNYFYLKMPTDWSAVICEKDWWKAVSERSLNRWIVIVLYPAWKERTLEITPQQKEILGELAIKCTDHIMRERKVFEDVKITPYWDFFTIFKPRAKKDPTVHGFDLILTTPLKPTKKSKMLKKESEFQRPNLPFLIPNFPTLPPFRISLSNLYPINPIKGASERIQYPLDRIKLPGLTRKGIARVVIRASKNVRLASLQHFVVEVVEAQKYWIFRSLSGETNLTTIIVVAKVNGKVLISFVMPPGFPLWTKISHTFGVTLWYAYDVYKLQTLPLAGRAPKLLTFSNLVEDTTHFTPLQDPSTVCLVQRLGPFRLYRLSQDDIYHRHWSIDTRSAGFIHSITPIITENDKEVLTLAVVGRGSAGVFGVVGAGGGYRSAMMRVEREENAAEVRERVEEVVRSIFEGWGAL